jgi:hypothetical protein
MDSITYDIVFSKLNVKRQRLVHRHPEMTIGHAQDLIVMHASKGPDPRLRLCQDDGGGEMKGECVIL